MRLSSKITRNEDYDKIKEHNAPEEVEVRLLTMLGSGRRISGVVWGVDMVYGRDWRWLPSGNGKRKESLDFQ